MDIAELRAELERLHCSSFGWALSCCRRDRAEAEEVLQTAYLKVLEGKARFGGAASFKTWLFAVIRKTALSEHRRNLIRRLKLITTAELAEPVSAPAQQATALERSEIQMRFRRALESLPRRQREALHLVFYEELSLSEAAEVMGVSIGSARQHYERGKNRLREYLEQKEIEYGIKWRPKENPDVV